MKSVSRRGLLTGGVAAAVLSATGMPTRAARAGGTLRLALSGEPPQGAAAWDMRRAGGYFQRALGPGAIFDCLTEIAATGELTGELAQSWEATQGARVWTFDLRPGVRFHDGSPFGADDVIASIDLHRDDASPVAPIARTIAAMDKTGAHQVRFVLAEGNADFPFLMADPHFAIYPHRDIAGAMAHGIGTGLYRVTDAGARMRLGRVRGHYKDGRAGWFEAIEARAMPLATDRLGALTAGHVDAIDGPDFRPDFRPESGPAFDDAAALGAQGRIAILRQTGNRHLHISLSGPAFDDPALRAALGAGIDRQGLVDRLLGGRGCIAADHPVGPANAHWLPPNPAPAPAAPAAGLRIALTIDGHPAPPDLAPFTAASGLVLAADGLPLEARFRPGWPTDDAALTLGAGPEALAEFGGLLRAARCTLDSDRRAELYHRLQALVADQGRGLVPVSAPTLSAHARSLAHPEAIGALDALDSGRIAERWWFA